MGQIKRTMLLLAFGAVALPVILAACKEVASATAATFEATEPTLLSVNSPTKDEDPSVLLARDGTIFVAWFSDRGGNPDIYLTTTKNGRDWTPAKRVTTNSGGDFLPTLLQDAHGTFHLSWFRWTAPFVGHVMYNTSPDGVTWNTATEIQATNAPNVDDWVPTMAVAPDGTVLIYFVSKLRNTSNQQNDIYLARKGPGMAAFDVVVGADFNSPTMHDHLPFVARTGNNFSIVWVRHDLSKETPWENPKSDLYLATSSNGTTWSAPTKITNEAGNIVHLFPTCTRTRASNGRCYGCRREPGHRWLMSSRSGE